MNTDTKLSHINRFLSWAIENGDDKAKQTARGVLSGDVPVIDATGIDKLWRKDHQQFWSIAERFSDAVETGTKTFPVVPCLLFSTQKVTHLERSFDLSRFLMVLSVNGATVEAVHHSVGSHGVFFHDMEVKGTDRDYMLALLLSVGGWMTMKNAETEDALPARAFRRRYPSIASVRFRSIYIRSTKKNANGTRDRYMFTGDNCPLHHVRGHVRVVSPDRPLFGRAGEHGEYWISEHWRGDEKHGRIVQTYVVEPSAA